MNLYGFAGNNPVNEEDPSGLRRIYIHNPGHQTQPVTINNGYEPPMTISGYNNTNYTVDIPNGVNLEENMEIALAWRNKWGYDIFKLKSWLSPYVRNQTVGDYGKNHACYPHSNRHTDPTLYWERRYGANFNFGVMGAAAGANLWELLLGGQWYAHPHFSHPQPEQDAIEDGYWYFYMTHPGYGISPPEEVVIHQGPPDNDPN